MAFTDREMARFARLDEPIVPKLKLRANWDLVCFRRYLVTGQCFSPRYQRCSLPARPQVGQSVTGRPAPFLGRLRAALCSGVLALPPLRPSVTAWEFFLAMLVMSDLHGRQMRDTPMPELHHVDSVVSISDSVGEPSRHFLDRGDDVGAGI